jgi:amino acid permease
MFGVDTDQVVIHSFPNNDVLIEVVNIGFFLVVNASYVMVALQVMTDLGAMIYNEHDPKKISWKRRAPLLLLTNGLPVVIAMVLPSVRPAFEIGGAFGGCLSNFFFPAVLYWWYSGLKIWHWKSLLLGFIALFGFISMVLGTYEAVVDAIASFKHGSSE